MRKYLTVHEAAEIVRKSDSWLYRRIKEKKCPATTIGRTTVVPEDLFERWLSDQTQGGRLSV